MIPARACAVWMCLMSVGALAGAAESESERIKAERAAATTKFEAQERECQSQFLVTSCVDAARKEQRATMARLRQQEILLDESRRRDAAAVRSQASRDRAAAEASRASDATRSEQGEGTHKQYRAPAPNPPRAGAPKPAASTQPADQRLIEQQNEANFETRARASKTHRQEVERRNAERAAQGKVAMPLPAPGGASAP